MTAIIAAFLISTNATAHEIISSCRSMIPADVELKGRIILRNRRGIVKAEHQYSLLRTNAKTKLSVDGNLLDAADSKNGSIMGTDVTWSDLTLDYLWWDDVAFDSKREGETVHGQSCTVLTMRKGERAVRVWVDRKTGALMQAEEFEGERTIRRLWGTRLKKFGDRWMANVMEVETVGSGHRTKITVEELK